ncbi:MAG: alcohol dehydrogenase catalytic domain-containing protein [Halioglobus sp.]
MKAAVFREVGRPLVVETVADPAPAPSELVMKVAYCGICGTDLHATRAGLTTACCGQILGHEYVGEIVEVGPQAEGDWRVGDRVCAMPFIACGRCLPCAAGRFFECSNKKVSGVDDPGGFAEFVTTGCRETLRLPPDLDLRSAALVEPLAVGIHAVRMADVRAGSRVLVIGAGPIGLTVALWCRRRPGSGGERGREDARGPPCAWAPRPSSTPSWKRAPRAFCNSLQMSPGARRT